MPKQENETCISRMAEQALSSILDFVPKENESESSKSLDACSLSRENAGPVVQSGMNAAFAMRKSRVQIPPGPLLDLNPFGFQF